MLFRLSRGTCYRELRFSRTPDKSGNPNQLAVTQRNGRSDGNPHDCQPGYESNGAHRGELSIPHPVRCCRWARSAGLGHLTSFQVSAQRPQAQPLGGNRQGCFIYGALVSLSVFRKATIAASSAGVKPRLPTSLVMLVAYSGAGQPAPGTSRVL